jgi:hypothetical protein
VICLAPSAFAQAVPTPADTQPVVTSVPRTPGLTPIPATVVAPELQEQGVFYLHNVMTLPVQGKVENVTTMYVHRDFTSPVGTLIPGQIIEVVGIAPEGYLVRAVAPNSNVMGWIRLDQIPSNIDQRTLVQAQQYYQREQEIQVAIANKTVIQGMTPEDVEKSLGSKAPTILKQTLPQGVFETWTYTTYKQVPQNSYAVDSMGQPVSQTEYDKVAIGTLTINFTNGVVTSIQEQRSDPDSPGVYAQNQQQQVAPTPDTAPVVVVQPQPTFVQADNSSSYVVPGQVYYPVWGGYGYGYQNGGGYNRPTYNYQNNYNNHPNGYQNYQNQHNNQNNNYYHAGSTTSGGAQHSQQKSGNYYNYSYNNPSNKH